MHVSLAHPEGYGLIPEVVETAKQDSRESGGTFEAVSSMEEAFRDADVVYPKSWAPYGVMQRRALLQKGRYTKGCSRWKGMPGQQREIQELGMRRKKK